MTKKKTIDLRLEGELMQFVGRVSSDSGKKPETVIAVMLALYMQRLENEHPIVEFNK